MRTDRLRGRPLLKERALNCIVRGECEVDTKRISESLDDIAAAVMAAHDELSSRPACSRNALLVSV